MYYSDVKNVFQLNYRIEKGREKNVNIQLQHYFIVIGMYNKSIIWDAGLHFTPVKMFILLCVLRCDVSLSLHLSFGKERGTSKLSTKIRTIIIKV